MAIALLVTASPLVVGNLALTSPPAVLAVLVVVGVLTYGAAARLLRIEELGVALRAPRKPPATRPP